MTRRAGLSASKRWIANIVTHSLKSCSTLFTTKCMIALIVQQQTNMDVKKRKKFVHTVIVKKSANCFKKPLQKEYQVNFLRTMVCIGTRTNFTSTNHKFANHKITQHLKQVMQQLLVWLKALRWWKMIVKQADHMPCLSHFLKKASQKPKCIFQLRPRSKKNKRLDGLTFRINLRNRARSTQRS